MYLSDIYLNKACFGDIFVLIFWRIPRFVPYVLTRDTILQLGNSLVMYMFIFEKINNSNTGASGHFNSHCPYLQLISAQPDPVPSLRAVVVLAALGWEQSRSLLDLRK